MRAVPTALLVLLLSGCAGQGSPPRIAAPIVNSGLEEITIVALGME